jgi:hypothetical protein
MTLHTRITRLELRSTHRLRVVFASEVGASFAHLPRRLGETIIVLSEEDALL